MENNTTSNHHHHQPPICANQNLMHVKFHVNKFQDNLLSKRLKQLNNEEMKTRLKHQRTSNELIYFLRECQKSTGYYSKMNEYKRGGGMKSNEEQATTTVIEKCISLCPTSDSTTSTRASSLSSHVIRPSTGRFRSSSYSNCFPQLKTNDKLLARRSIDESATHRASLFIDAATALSTSTSTPNTPNSNSSGIANISSSKTSTSRSSNSSSNSAFSSNSSESFGVVDSSSLSSSAASRVLSTSTSTRTTVSIIRPQTAQLSSKKLLFTKLPQPKIICNASKKSSLTDSTTISNLDWFYSNPLGFDQEDLVTLSSSSSSTNNNTNSILSVSNNTAPEFIKKPDRHLKSESFKSKSMNFSSLKSSMDSTLVNTARNETGSIDVSKSQPPPIKVRKVVINSRNVPIKINMSRSSIRKRQVEIMNEYNRYNSLELLNNLRQIQKNLDTKVKQFASNSNSNSNSATNKNSINTKA